MRQCVSAGMAVRRSRLLGPHVQTQLTTASCSWRHANGHGWHASGHGLPAGCKQPGAAHLSPAHLTTARWPAEQRQTHQQQQQLQAAASGRRRIGRLLQPLPFSICHQRMDPFAVLTGGASFRDSAERRRSQAAAEAPRPAAGTSDAAAHAQQGAPQVPVARSNDPHETANLLRKALRIKVKGSDAPPPLQQWSDVALARPQQQLQPQPRRRRERAAAVTAPACVGPQLLQCLAANGWDTPTPIQRQAVPALLAGRELLAVAPTGSGKTLAFLLPMLALLARSKAAGGAAWPAAPKALLLSPTHELAAQTVRVLKALLPGSGLRCCLLSRSSAGGSDFSKVDVLVANPLRLKLLVQDGRVDLSHVSYLVLDEADKLLEMGFMQQVDALLAAASNPAITRALFSATLPDKVEELARSVLRDPLHVVVGQRNSSTSSVSQQLKFVGREEGKLLALRQLIAAGLAPPVLVFVSSKARASQLHKALLYDGLRVDSISGDQPASARTAAVDAFRGGATWLLVATDLVGRGMDFAGVSTVVNYDFPASSADYIHRVGRTGRAGHTGSAITFFTEEDAPRLRSIAHLVADAGSEVPDWMLHMAKQPKQRKRRRRGDMDVATDDDNVQSC